MTLYEQFWDMVLWRFTAVGLPLAIRSAQRDAGVDAATVSRWLQKVTLPEYRSDRSGGRELPSLEHHSRMLHVLLESCLHVRRGTVDPLPRPSDLPGDDVALEREDSQEVWQLLVHARRVAALVRGEAMPSWLDWYAPDITRAWPFHRLSRESAIRDLPGNLRRRTPDQAWDRKEAEEWLRGWEHPKRQELLRTVLFGEQVTWQYSLFEEAVDPHPTEIGPIQVRKLLSEHPLPQGLDPECIEVALGWTLREHCAPVSSHGDPDRLLAYWLVATASGEFEVRITTRRRVVGLSHRRAIEGLPTSWGTQRLYSAGIRETAEEVAIPFSPNRHGVSLILKKL